LERHLEIFPEGQFIADAGGQIVGSCSNTLISEERWQAHTGWGETVGGPMLKAFDRNGSTLYGLDITVHPDFRRIGVGRAFYTSRFALKQVLGLTRYGTACRMPGYASQSANMSVDEYAQRVVSGELSDQTLTPLLRYGLTFLGVLHEYMEDQESANAGALLEWTE
jgi:GNAT superfamily N-acetyltransferase